MSKIFRNYTGGADTYTDWNESTVFPYNAQNRETITDPNGAKPEHEITSIPSPFARIDLVKNAFREVNASKELDGNTIFHKTVSDVLDIGELFFNYDKFQDRFEIIKWDPAVMLSSLQDSATAGQRYLGEALAKFLTADAAVYNFDRMKSIYMLHYKEGPDRLNLIGATSPATLFFSTANRLDYVSQEIAFGQDRPFDGQYQPLWRRDFEYVKMWFALQLSIPGFAGLFPEVDEYLNLTLRAITDPDRKRLLQSMTAQEIDSYPPIAYQSDNQQNTVEVLGYALRRAKIHRIDNSDFEILTSRSDVVLPLVLPTEGGNKYQDLIYTTASWGTMNKAPYVDPLPLDERRLPFDGSKQPYLTLSDFLEESVVRVPHRLNERAFFAGNFPSTEQCSYLLPLKPLFFRYFTPDELRRPLPGGENMLVIEPTAVGEGIRVTLRIPIRGRGKVDHIEYTRIYYSNRAAEVDKNEGSVVEIDFAGLLMPNLRFSDPQEAIYRVACMSGSKGIECTFYAGDQALNGVVGDCRNNQSSDLSTQVYSIEGQNFDYVQICSKSRFLGVLVPVFRQPANPNDAFEFAVDLGTSNTHIEFRKNGESIPQSFGFTAEDRPFEPFFVPSVDQQLQLQLDLIEENQILEKDFLPFALGIGSEFTFPTRTVLSCARQVDWNRTVRPFGLVNVPFTYDKRQNMPYNTIRHNMKWGTAGELKTYVECLLFTLRNKVLLNNGDLKRTKLTWFYPISMPRNRVQQLRQTWDEAYEKYFGLPNTSSVSESIAPVAYFVQKYNNARDLINVDIGGGTTDLAFVAQQEVKCVSSVRFAANALFHDSLALSNLDLRNGIIDTYAERIRRMLPEGHELAHIFREEQNRYPVNMASFLFSLHDNSKLDGLNPKNFDLNFLLQQDEDFKIVFILFYSAIIYHAAQIVREKNLPLPRYISFSGNGSKIVQILSGDMQILSEYAKLIFERVLERPYGGALEILGLHKGDNPKESTCKGGLIAGANFTDRKETVILKVDGQGFVAPNETLEQIDEVYLMEAVQAVERFFDLILDRLSVEFKFRDNFGVKPEALALAREHCKRDLKIYLETGLDQLKKEGTPQDPICETLFFFPIKGVLQALSTAIYESLNQTEIR